MINKWVPNQIPEEVRNDVKSRSEEVANMISHGLGFLFFLIAFPFLIYSTLDIKHDTYLYGVIIFGISLLMVYASSTLYHSVYDEKLRRRMRVIDHISIYFLIAGSYTPFLLAHFPNRTGWTILGIQWGMVLLGTIFKLYYTHRFKLASTLVYVAMGWLAILIINPMIERLPLVSIIWIGIGGLFYTVGVVFYLWERLYHNHLIWHLFVLGGSISHFVAVVYCL